MPQPIEELIKQAVSFFQNGQTERAEIEFKKILDEPVIQIHRIGERKRKG